MNKNKPISIKNTISYICAILKFLGIRYITPEDLRSAKFNKHKNPDVFISLLCVIWIEIGLFDSWYHLSWSFELLNYK